MNAHNILNTRAATAVPFSEVITEGVDTHEKVQDLVLPESFNHDLQFDIPTLIEYCSTFTFLEAGDVIVTGTTGGVGAYRTPPLWMKPGDTVEVEVTGVGVLRNPIAAEA